MYLKQTLSSAFTFEWVGELRWLIWSWGSELVCDWASFVEIWTRNREYLLICQKIVFEIHRRNSIVLMQCFGLLGYFYLLGFPARQGLENPSIVCPLKGNCLIVQNKIWWRWNTMMKKYNEDDDDDWLEGWWICLAHSVEHHASLRTNPSKKFKIELRRAEIVEKEAPFVAFYWYTDLKDDRVFFNA